MERFITTIAAIAAAAAAAAASASACQLVMPPPPLLPCDLSATADTPLYLALCVGRLGTEPALAWALPLLFARPTRERCCLRRRAIWPIITMEVETLTNQRKDPAKRENLIQTQRGKKADEKRQRGLLWNAVRYRILSG